MISFTEICLVCPWSLNVFPGLEEKKEREAVVIDYEVLITIIIGYYF